MGVRANRRKSCSNPFILCTVALAASRNPQLYAGCGGCALVVARLTMDSCFATAASVPCQQLHWRGLRWVCTLGFHREPKTSAYFEVAVWGFKLLVLHGTIPTF
ncbi:hypothetical protein N431DRAFT_176381 [Stipitochalara longipes BDJ]|nr:hypothetical protein N431DRAFT_176381 [Stipitochalara longipes BDJ]